MKRETLTTGRLGEKLARDYLQNKGYKILEQNYRTRYAEIDLVAKEKDILVIVEVRTKVGERFGAPEETLKAQKLQKVKRNAAAYVAHIKWDKLYRVDAVCIVLGESRQARRLNHYVNIIS